MKGTFVLIIDACSKPVPAVIESDIASCDQRQQSCGLIPSVLGQDRSETKNSVLVLQVWCCFVKHDLVTLVVIMILKDTATFQVLFMVSLFCAWNITTVEINSGVHLLYSKSAKCLCLFPVILVLILVSRIWSCLHR